MLLPLSPFWTGCSSISPFPKGRDDGRNGLRRHQRRVLELFRASTPDHVGMRERLGPAFLASNCTMPAAATSRTLVPFTSMAYVTPSGVARPILHLRNELKPATRRRKDLRSRLSPTSISSSRGGPGGHAGLQQRANRLPLLPEGYSASWLGHQYHR
jgi:hypothetical protein